MEEANDFDMQPVVSSQISQVGYKPETRQLRVVFNHKGSIYDYEGVSQEVFDSLVNAPSVGSYFTAAVKNSFTFRRVA